MTTSKMNRTEAQSKVAEFLMKAFPETSLDECHAFASDMLDDPQHWISYFKSLREESRQ